MAVIHGKKKLWKLTMIPSLQKNSYVVSGLHYKPRDDTMNCSFKTWIIQFNKETMNYSGKTMI